MATSHTYVHLAACGFLRQKCVWKGSGIYYYPWPTTHLCTYQAWHWPVPCMSIAARKMRFRSKSHQRSRKQRQISFCKERRGGPNFAASTISVRSASQKMCRVQETSGHLSRSTTYRSNKQCRGFLITKSWQARTCAAQPIDYSWHFIIHAHATVLFLHSASGWILAG